MNIFLHPVLLAGFRPFFFLTCVTGIILPLLWALTYSNSFDMNNNFTDPTQWHAHEMFYGFGGAILGGFLLTASKNWVKIRGINGWPLALLCVFWLIERVTAFISPEILSFNLFVILQNLYFVGFSSYVLYSLIKYRKNDGFKDNYFFIIALPILIFSKNLMLINYGPHSVELTLGLFKLAFIIMLERTTTQFMKTSMNLHLYRKPILDYAIKFSVLLSIFAIYFPTALAISIYTAAALLLFLRFLLWHPAQGFKLFGNRIMYIGYLAIVLHYVFSALNLLHIHVGIGSLSTHIFTFLTMGTIIPAMILRISQGHTGRKIEFTFIDKLGHSFILAGAFARLILTQISPSYYNLWITSAGLLWSATFILLIWRVTPFLWHPRVDGKVH